MIPLTCVVPALVEFIETAESRLLAAGRRGIGDYCLKGAEFQFGMMENSGDE